MNHSTLVKYYNILRELKELSTVIHKADYLNVINFPNTTFLYDDEDNIYTMYFSSGGSNVQLVRTPKKNNPDGKGYSIAHCMIRRNLPRGQDVNYVGLNGNGFCFHGKGSTIQITDSHNTRTLLESLSSEATQSILSDGIDELEFQYGTLYDFVGDSFKMYCIFSLLNNIDSLHEMVGDDDEYYHLAFISYIPDAVALDSVLDVLGVLSTKVRLNFKRIQNS